MHSHGSSIKLTKKEQDILERGITQLLKMTKGLDWKEFPSDKHPLPLTQMSYQEIPKPSVLVDNIRKRMKSDPVSTLEDVLALLELLIVNKEYAKDVFHEDMTFIQRHCFAVKRLNGWIAVVGDTDKEKIELAINDKWNFKFYNGIGEEINSYKIMSMLVRYAFVYGGIEFGDAHALSHFLLDFGPGVIVCQGKLTDLELTLSLAAMKIGVPLIVPNNYPFTLGRKIIAKSHYEIVKAVTSFPNIRKLLHTPEITQLPDFCSRDNINEEFNVHKKLGVTDNSFYMLTKGKVSEAKLDIQGELCEENVCSMGIKITINEEPMDAFDQRHIERKIASDISLMSGVQSKYSGEKLEISVSKDVDIKNLPQQIGKILSYSIQHHFPKLKKILVEIIFDENQLKKLAPKIRFEKLQREKIISTTTEETIDKFYRCTSCSPFAPDHICIVTPERPPQCGKPFAQVKTGALYAYDDMTNVHHNPMHLDINLYGVVEKGELLDSVRGEWSGANEHAKEITQGRTSRIFLHTIEDYPHTGCSCFRLIIFRTNEPRKGIGIMDYSFKGKAPDGRNWRDLHYAIAGKQVPGMVAASFAYLSSPKFLQADGGWKNIIWISPKVAERVKNFKTEDIIVGD